MTEQTPARYEFKKKPGDGAHWGVEEPYPEVVAELMRAIDSGLDFDSGFYASKKEIESGRIERRGDVMWASVSVSDDFDCEAVGEADFPFAELVGKDSDERMRIIGAALDAARDKARESQRDNEVAALYLVGRDEGKYRRWEFTYLRDVSGFGFESPPGDNYHRWGWQEVDTDDDEDGVSESDDAFPPEIGKEAAEKIVEAIFRNDVDDAGKDGLVIDGWRVRLSRE